LSVRLERVSKSFDKLAVLKEFDLDIHKGELFSLVGPSGSGKTTLLRIIAGLERHDSGHVLINSRIVDDLGPSERNVGMVFQDYALYPNKTVEENIMSPLTVKGVKKGEARREAEEVAAKLKISETLGRRPGQISGGQQQRVALARSLIKKPDVFLLDEPLSNLDAQIRFEARKFLRDIQRDFGITTIYVTHDQSEALSISDRMAVMGNGVIHQTGTPREIYRSPGDEFVATFVGSPPLNVIELKFANGRSAPIDIELDGTTEGKVRVGVRPEHVLLGSGENEAEITALEYSGNDTIVYLRAGDQELRSLVMDASSLKVGQTVKFGIAPGQVLMLGRGEAGGLAK